MFLYYYYYYLLIIKKVKNVSYFWSLIGRTIFCATSFSDRIALVMSVIENKESLLSQEVEMDRKDDNCNVFLGCLFLVVFIPIEENNRSSSENNTNKSRRKSQTTKRTNGKKNSKCSIKCIIYSIILCCLIASIGYACFAIYNVVTKYSCNIFGISIARSMIFIYCRWNTDENELMGLEKCKKLTKLTILGTEWSSIRFKNGMFNTVEELDISRFLLDKLNY